MTWRSGASCMANVIPDLSLLPLPIIAVPGVWTACQSRPHQQQPSTRLSSSWKLNLLFTDTICHLLMHANILFNFVLLLHNSFLHFFRVKCPSSLWTQCHYYNPRLIIKIIIIRRCKEPLLIAWYKEVRTTCTDLTSDKYWVVVVWLQFHVSIWTH